MRTKNDVLEHVRVRLAQRVMEVLPHLRRRLTQKTLARAIDTTQAVVSSASCGCGTLGTYIAICRVLDIKFSITVENVETGCVLESVNDYIARLNAGTVDFKL